MDSTDKEARLALVIVVDGLRASALGTYGNTTVPTPRFDELASRSLVAEWLIANGPTLGHFYRSFYVENALPNVHCRLLTDDSSVASLAREGLFADVLQLEAGRDQRAKELEASHAASFFSQAVEHLTVWHNAVAEKKRSGLLWVHFSGLSSAWDAPLAMRQDLLDDDDPTAPHFVEPPRELRGITDPDELLGYRVAYAAQVSLIETCLAGFVEAFEGLPFQAKKLTMIAGSRGFALGEHGSIGCDCQSLYSEQLHLPWLTVVGGSGPLPRVPGFAQPADLAATLYDWLTGEPAAIRGGHSLVPYLDSGRGLLREAVIATSASGGTMIRTPAWMMIQGAATELYVKPDDRWEANDVASRCPEIIKKLAQHCGAIEADRAPPLTDELVSVWR